MPFDPFTEGGAVAEHPEEGAFDPFKSGGIADEPQAPTEIPRGPLGDNWRNLYNGLDTLDQRLGPDEKLALRNLDDVSDNSKAARAQAINQGYVQSVLGSSVNHSFIEANWPSVRDAFANQIGIAGKDITDTQLYGAIAKHYTDDEKAQAEKEQGEVKPWTGADELKRAFLRPYSPYYIRQGLETFWTALNKPAVELPEPPADLPDIPGLGLNNPALVGGVYKGLKPLLEGIESPFGILTVGAGAELKAAAEVGAPLAKTALKGMTGLFSAWMGYGATKGAIKAPAILNDPNASMQDKVAAVVEPVAEGAMALAGVMDMAFGKMPEAKANELAKSLEGKTPAEAADAFRAAAKEAIAEPPKLAEGKAPPAPEESYAPAHDFLMDAAREMDRLATPEEKTVIKEGKKAEKDAEKASEAHDNALNPPETPVLPKPAPEAPKPTVERPTQKAVSIKNEAVDAEMESMGLREPTHGEKTTFEKARADAAKRIEEDSHAGTKLVEDLRDKPRAPTAVEDALLTHELNRLKIERDAAEAELLSARDSGDQANVMDAMVRVRRAREAYSDAADVATKVGTASGQSLAFRRLALKEDYSLARLEHRMRVSKKGEAPTEAELAPIRELQKQLEDAGKRITDLESKARQPAEPPQLPETAREAPRKRPPSKVSSFISEQAKAARERIKARQAEGRTFSNPLDPQAAADAAIVGAEYITKGVTKFADWSAEMVKELGEHIRPFLADIFKQAIDATDQATKLQAYKRRTEAAIEKGQAKLDSGDLSKPVRKSLQLDPEAIKLKADYERIKQEIDQRIYEAEQASRHPLEKFVDSVLRYRKVGLISGMHTLGKVGAAGMTRIGMTAADSAAGSLLNKLPVLSDIAEGAPREGLKTGATLEHAVKGYVEGWKQTVDQAWNVLKYGKTDVEIMSGETRGDVSAINYLVNTHALAKLPAFAQEYHISLRERTAYEIGKGTDMENPINQMRVNNEAVADGLRAKFSQDNFVTERFNMMIRSLENTKAHPTTGKVIASVMRFLFPIVKIPSNFFAEGITYSNLGAGIPRAILKTVQAMQKGVDKLTPAQSDSIMRHWKKGSLGAGLMLLGYYMRDEIGGYYQPGKRKGNEPEFGGIRLFGHDIPRWLVHMPIMEPLHFGATFGHVLDHLDKKNSSEAENPLKSAALAASGLIGEAPYVSGSRNMVDAFSSGPQGDYARGEMLKGAILPRILSEIAEMTDTDSHGDPIKRKASNLREHIQSGIPGLRQELPKKK